MKNIALNFRKKKKFGFICFGDLLQKIEINKIENIKEKKKKQKSEEGPRGNISAQARKRPTARLPCAKPVSSPLPSSR
jgi:hypothetical protein